MRGSWFDIVDGVLFVEDFLLRSVVEMSLEKGNGGTSLSGEHLTKKLNTLNCYPSE